MKIASSDMFLGTEHAAVARRERSETLRAWTGGTRPDFEGLRTANDRRPIPPDAVVRISDAARALATHKTPVAPPPTSAEVQAIQDGEEVVNNDPLLQLVKAMVEMLTGHSIKVFTADMLSQRVEHAEFSSRELTAAATPRNGPQRAGYGVEYDARQVIEEAEATTISAEGVIRTTDGQEISFKLDLSMVRYHREETTVSVRAGDAVRKDPLVINFGGNAAQLGNQRFLFDLDGDGQSELLPVFTSGSGYLVLDRNHNGTIDSGMELFGPASNAGFDELAALDQDGNGWIDENDSAFEELRIWTPATEGAGSQVGLKTAGVGALSLAHIATPFELRGDANSNLGAVRATGVWLSEQGAAGSLQEIDLTV